MLVHAVAFWILVVCWETQPWLRPLQQWRVRSPPIVRGDKSPYFTISCLVANKRRFFGWSTTAVCREFWNHPQRRWRLWPVAASVTMLSPIIDKGLQLAWFDKVIYA
jgi:hypothetical protein